MEEQQEKKEKRCSLILFFFFPPLFNIMPGPELGAQPPHAAIQAGKVPVGNGPGGVCRCSPEHEPPVCPGGQGGQRQPGSYQE